MSTSSTPSQYLLLFENETKMPYAVAEVAWVHDAIPAFRIKFSFRGPEKTFVGPE